MTDGSQLQNLLQPALATDPEKLAIRFGAQSLTYRGLGLEVGRAASALLRQGIQAGDRVAWLLPNCLEAVVATMACYRVGAIAVPLNYRYVADEARYVLGKIDSRALIFHADRKTLIRSLLPLSGPMQTCIVGSTPDTSSFLPWANLLDQDPMDEYPCMTEDAPALILYTSGSTGQPKGVVHSHRSAFYGIDISRRALDIRSEDIVLVGKPISHAGGLQTQLMPTLLSGGQVVLAMKPAPAEAASLITRFAVSQYAMLASDLLDFIEYLEESGIRLPSLRNSIGSGDSVPVELHHRFRDLFGWEVMEGSGMTEVNSYYAINPRYGKRKWGSLGLPCPDTELRIIRRDGSDAAEQEVGEILIRTPSATTGYWQDPASTRELIGGGWLHTGDLARADDEGYLWFVGRSKLLIVRRGSNIAPAEVENVLDEHPQVHASVVVGIPDEHDGHVPVAWIAPLHTSATPAESDLRDYVSAHLAAYKRPVR
jgi:long-chain acyl-CoA synthetase